MNHCLNCGREKHQHEQIVLSETKKLLLCPGERENPTLWLPPAMRPVSSPSAAA
jgi:hypothetical protein